mgnify:CR=1 FL=1
MSLIYDKVERGRRRGSNRFLVLFVVVFCDKNRENFFYILFAVTERYYCNCGLTPSDSLLALLIRQGNLTEQDADRLITWEEWQDGVRFDAQGNKIDERDEAEAARKSLDRKLGDMRMKLLARRAKAEERVETLEARAEILEAEYKDVDGGEISGRDARG